MPTHPLPVATLAACLVFAGCTSLDDAVPARPARAASIGKPAAPVALNFNVAHSIAAGEPSPVEIDLSAGIDADSLEVEWVPSAGLMLAKTDVALNIANVQKNKLYRNTVTVSAAGNGEYFLGIVATLRRAGYTQTRAFSIRIVVGTALAKAKSVLPTDAQGNAVESLPAQESVSK